VLLAHLDALSQLAQASHSSAAAVRRAPELADHPDHMSLAAVSAALDKDLGRLARLLVNALKDCALLANLPRRALPKVSGHFFAADASESRALRPLYSAFWPRTLSCAVRKPRFTDMHVDSSSAYNCCLFLVIAPCLRLSPHGPLDLSVLQVLLLPHLDTTPMTPGQALAEEKVAPSTWTANTSCASGAGVLLFGLALANLEAVSTPALPLVALVGT
jgi:hypothetical protein